MKTFTKTEVENVALQIENIIRKKRVLFFTELEEHLAHMSKKEKKQVLRQLTKLKYIIQKGDSLHYNEKVEVEESNEEEIFNALIRPEYVDTNKNDVQVGNRFYQGFYATGFPSSVTENWLSKLVKEKENIDFSLHLTPSNVAALQVYLDNELKRVNADLYHYQQRGVPNPFLEEKKRQIQEAIASIAAGKFKLYGTSLFLMAKGSELDKVIALGKGIQSSLRGEGIESERADYHHQELLKSAMPIGWDFLKDKKINVPDDALAASFPFSSSFLDVDEEDGVLLGFNERGLPVARTIWKEKSYSYLILGSTGSGKSYSSKALILNEKMANGTRILILDPQDEYGRLCRAVSGNPISLSRKSKTIPNLLGLYGGNLNEKLTSLMHIFGLLFGGEDGKITDAQRPLLSNALIGCYASKGIYRDQPHTWSRAPPILSDLEKTLKLKRHQAGGRDKSTFDVLLSRLSQFTSGIYSFLDQPGGELDVKPEFVTFDISNIPSDVKPVLMLTVLEYAKQKMLEMKDKKLLVIDEAHLLLRNPSISSYIEELIRIVRKFNGGVMLITQTVGELMACAEGKAVLANSFAKYVFATEPVYLEETAKLFSLNDVEKNVIATASVGQGILAWGNQHFLINIAVDPATHRLITTSPEELAKIEAEQVKKAQSEEETVLKLIQKHLKEKW